MSFSIQVVEVEKTISVESKETLKNLAAAQAQNIKLKTQLSTLKKLCADHEERYKLKMIEIKEMQKKVGYEIALWVMLVLYNLGTTQLQIRYSF